jgi:hypothetical protein
LQMRFGLSVEHPLPRNSVLAGMRPAICMIQ